MTKCEITGCSKEAEIQTKNPHWPDDPQISLCMEHFDEFVEWIETHD